MFADRWMFDLLTIVSTLLLFLDSTRVLNQVDWRWTVRFIVWIHRAPPSQQSSLIILLFSLEIFFFIFQHMNLDRRSVPRRPIANFCLIFVFGWCHLNLSFKGLVALFLSWVSFFLLHPMYGQAEIFFLFFPLRRQDVIGLLHRMDLLLLIASMMDPWLTFSSRGNHNSQP